MKMDNAFELYGQYILLPMGFLAAPIFPYGTILHLSMEHFLQCLSGLWIGMDLSNPHFTVMAWLQRLFTVFSVWLPHFSFHSSHIFHLERLCNIGFFVYIIKILLYSSSVACMCLTSHKDLLVGILGPVDENLVAEGPGRPVWHFKWSPTKRWKTFTLLLQLRGLESHIYQ